MSTLVQHPGAVGEVLNVGHTKDISSLELAQLVKRLTESSSEVVLVPFAKAYNPDFEDMPRRLPSIKKIERLIGYRPTKDLSDILEEVIQYTRARHEGESVGLAMASAV